MDGYELAQTERKREAIFSAVANAKLFGAILSDNAETDFTDAQRELFDALETPPDYAAAAREAGLHPPG